MPYHRRRARPRRRNKHPGISTVPRMMTTYQRRARHNNVSSKIFYLKDNGTLSTDVNGTIQQVWNVQGIYANPQFVPCAALYQQFKVIGMTVKLYPANVGIEPDPSALPVGDNGLFRGDCVVWGDQRPGQIAQFPTTVSAAINYGSAQIIQPRRKYKRTMFRATGFPDWGSTDVPAVNDQWRGTLNLLQTNATPAAVGGNAPVMWYWMRTLKVIFRGRKG